jgi:LEA14-like dessication related protein
LSSASEGSGRFYLHTTPGTLGIREQLDDQLTIIPMPLLQKVRIVGKVTSNSVATIYEMNGRIVGFERLSNSNENEIPFRPLSSGVYLLKIQTGTGLITRKICWVE